jgi:dTDP-4-dehydrorhamnose reductase
MLVVTGASGLLGANILLKAHKQGRPVTGLCHHHLVYIPEIPVCSVDLTDWSKVRDIIASLRPTEIIHCAALTNIDWCEDHPEEANRVNADSSAYLAQLALNLGARFLYVSTDAVFDGKRMNYVETDNPAPLNVYGLTKLRGEQEVLRQNSSAAVARVNIYGWNVQNKLSLAEWILDELAKGKSVPGFTDVYFTPILANDLADVLFAVLDHTFSGIYHIGGSERISKYEFARRVAVEFGFDPSQVVPTPVGQAGLRAKRALDMSMNTEKISAAVGRAMPNVESGLRRFRELREAGYPKELKTYLHGTWE